MTTDVTYDLDLPLNGKNTAELFSRINEPEKLLRLHPHWHLEEIDHGNGTLHAAIRDHASEKKQRIRLSSEIKQNGALALFLDTKNHPVHIQLNGDHDRLVAVITTDLAEDRFEAEYNLGLWLRSIREYLRLYLSANPLRLFFRPVMNHAVLKMNPSQRKICLMIFRFTLLEIFVILLIVIGYFLFNP